MTVEIRAWVVEVQREVGVGSGMGSGSRKWEWDVGCGKWDVGRGS